MPSVDDECSKVVINWLNFQHLGQDKTSTSASTGSPLSTKVNPWIAIEVDGALHNHFYVNHHFFDERTAIWSCIRCVAVDWSLSAISGSCRDGWSWFMKVNCLPSDDGMLLVQWPHDHWEKAYHTMTWSAFSTMAAPLMATTFFILWGEIQLQMFIIDVGGVDCPIVTRMFEVVAFKSTSIVIVVIIIFRKSRHQQLSHHSYHWMRWYLHWWMKVGIGYSIPKAYLDCEQESLWKGAICDTFC